ncbi:putative OSBP(Oxysterol binding protein)-related protein 4B [Heracleum sosnowskyi]|uniref:OSBP(Oxysterol binding protein)-related protein 4B n=1 Tax=Heracleum sosnowskyi TaxID=360622 RepID=A0AAD8N8M6_9APIA|nr:putative OSBP(Oxysterol binding protein)-related protein 4B [Heracleum sosnowskyi]
MYENQGDSGNVVRKIDQINIQSSRFLSRESSVGQSSRIYHRSAEGVPFNWETQPGTPKIPRQEEVIPPPTPPPGSQKIFPPLKQCADYLSKEDSNHAMHKLWFWRKHWKKQQTHKDFGRRCHAGQVLTSNLKSRKFDDQFADFGGEFRGWVDDSSISDSKSSSSSNGTLHQSKDDDHEPRSDDHGVHKPFGCSPWNMTGIMVRVVKRA